MTAMLTDDDHQSHCAHCGFNVPREQLVRGTDNRAFHSGCLDELVEQEEAAAVAAENALLNKAA